jgi:hypothetical protein
MSPPSDIPQHSTCTGTELQRLDRMERVLNEVKTALVGNEALGNKGIVNRLKEVEVGMTELNRIRADEVATRKGALAVLSAVAAICGSIGAAVYSFLSRLNHS